MKLFIEEAREELAKIQRSFPVWDQNPLEREALVTVRRSFHTLKGSGRMVGARELGEFAWSIENLLNRVLDNTLTRVPAILEVLRDAVAALPQLIEQLENGSPATADVAGIAAARMRWPSATAAAPVARIAAVAAAEAARLRRALGRGARGTASRSPRRQHRHRASPRSSSRRLRQPQQPAGAAGAAASAQPAQRAAPPLDGRGAARDLRARDQRARRHGARLPRSARRSQPEPHLLPEDVYRACHTLSGSSKMAQARHGMRLAEPLDHWLRRAFTAASACAPPT